MARTAGAVEWPAAPFGGQAVAPRRGLHPALVLAVLGAGLSLGVGGAFQLWWVPLRPYDAFILRLGETPRRRGTLWEAVAGAATSLREFPQPWQGDNVVVAVILLGVGAAAGLGCWAPLGCLRPPLPPTGSRPAQPHRQPQPPPQGDERPWEAEGNVRRDCQPHRGNWLKALGTLALLLGFVAGAFVCLGVVSVPFGMVVWRLAARDLAEMR